MSVVDALIVKRDAEYRTPRRGRIAFGKSAWVPSTTSASRKPAMLRWWRSGARRITSSTFALIKEIADAFEALDHDAECRALVLAAQGKSFCAGANFGDGDRRRRRTSERAEARRAHISISKATVCSAPKSRSSPPIHGAAVGGGLGLAMVADFRVTCAEARFCANFTRLGFHPGFGLTVTLAGGYWADQGGADVLHQPPRARR